VKAAEDAVKAAEQSMEVVRLREELTSMAYELVRLQDVLDVKLGELHEAHHRLVQYDSDTLQLSKQLAADNASLRGMLDKLRQAHTLATCADETCGVCAVLYPPPNLRLMGWPKAKP
jgi:hypothetical protein